MKTKTTKRKRMAWKKLKRIGFITLYKDKTGEHYQVCYREPGEKWYTRRVIVAENEAVAIDKATAYNQEITAGNRVPGLKERPKVALSVRDALVEAIKVRGGSKRVKADYVYTANLFLEWLDAKYPKVVAWNQVRPSMIALWMDSQQDTFAWATLKNRISVIRHVSSYWATEEPAMYKDVGKQARVKLAKPPAKDPPAMTVEQLVAYLDWLKDNGSPLHYAMAVLCAFTGLRMREAAYLRHCDLDFAAGTVTVTRTTCHAPKTPSSYRTIPVLPNVLECLREYMATAPVQSANAEGEVFLNVKGRPYTHAALTSSWRDVINKARYKSDLVLPVGFIPRNLRATFITMAYASGADFQLLQRYIGHSSQTMLGDHYLRVEVDDLRERVCVPVGRYFAAQLAAYLQSSGNMD